ncbi:hypothetical protein, conserved [Eimeria acervulina]|uniref:Uncharacterized protein n=1 Tax=Eimeria acervulina TaxID=5801 RepID=U6GS57_EIMAC|nr:hypothetical protein, conserved [Eimeria acervulina]CDI82093.1 hypothetical protein, conserved [Eimeria acervulina]
MRREPPDGSPGLHTLTVTDQDAAEFPAWEDQTQHAIQGTGGRPGLTTGSTEGENNAIPPSRVAKKTQSAILAALLLALFVATAFGGYLLNIKRREDASPAIKAPTTPTQSTSESAAQESPSPPVPGRSGAPASNEVPSPLRSPRRRETRRPRRTLKTLKSVDRVLTEALSNAAQGSTEGAATEGSQDILAGEGDAEGDEDGTSETPKDLAEELKSLEEAWKRFEKAWSSSSETVQGAFVRNYMPNPTGGIASTPVDFYRRQTSFCKMDARSGKLTPGANANTAMDIALVKAMLCAASSRISLLQQIEELCETTGIGSVLLGREAAALPPVDILEKDPDRATFDDFMLMLKKRAFRVSASALETAGTVPTVLAQRLAASVKLETMQLENDREVHSTFQRFALSLPWDQVNIVHAGETIFGVAPFMDVLGRTIIDRETYTLDAESLGSWIQDWDTEGVLGRIGLNEDYLKDVLELRQSSYSTSTPDDMFAAALALI